MKLKTYYILSLATAFWFLFTSWLWSYWLNLFVSFPFAILSWYLLKKSEEKKPIKYNIIIMTLSLGALNAIISLMFFVR